MLKNAAIFLLLVTASLAIYEIQSSYYSVPRVNDRQFPFMVAIQVKLDSDGFYIKCGGVIISPDYVLSSAGCLKCHNGNCPKDRIISETVNAKYGGLLHLIKERFIHDNYKEGVNDYNLAIARVTPLFLQDLSGLIFPKIFAYPDRAVTFLGWGATSKTKSAYNYPDTLQQADLELITNCNMYGFNVTRRQLCTRNYVGNGLCSRDEGGPLVVLSDNDFLLIGIATEQYSCGNGFPDVYTGLEEFIPWINKTCGCIR